jgi:hypothetical protein
MASVVISGDTSGAITLAAPAVSGTNTATLPAATGTVMVSGNMPAFGAKATSGQVIAGGLVKILFGTEEFDTNNNFASSAFTPTVAGYYQLNFAVGGSWSNTELATYIHKNGSQFKQIQDIQMTINYSGIGSCIVYANGSTDYFEVYIYSATAQTLSAGTATWFNGSMVRSA